MPQINLKKYYYPLYAQDTFIEVSDEVAEALLLLYRAEHNRDNKIRYHKAFYSLDLDNGIEKAFLDDPTPSPEKLYLTQEEEKLRQLLLEQMVNEVYKLPPVQARRVYLHYLAGIKVRDIAKAEGVTLHSVYQSLRDGLKNLKKKLANQRRMNTE